MFYLKKKVQNSWLLVCGLVVLFAISFLFSGMLREAFFAIEGSLPRAEYIQWTGKNIVTAKGEREVEIPILMYHCILKNRSNDYIISPEAFEEDLKYLKEEGYRTIVMQDLIDFVYTGKSLPSKPIILTFDDGHYNNMYYAEPLLKEYGYRAVISVVGEFTEKAVEENDVNPNYSYLTWEHIKEISENGIFEIQNHSWNLHSSNSRCNGSKQIKGEADSQYKGRLYSDLSKLQNKLYEVTGVFPTTFTFPFGAMSNDQNQYLKEMGFLASLSCKEAVSTVKEGDPDSLFRLGRYNRESGRSARRILAN